MNRPTDHYILRDIDNRDDGGAPYETRPTTLADLANYVDGPLLSDLTDPSNADEVRRIAAEMREGRLSDESHARLRGLSVYIRKDKKQAPRQRPRRRGTQRKQGDSTK